MDPLDDEKFLSKDERIDRELERDFHKDIPAGEDVDSRAPHSEYMGLNADQIKGLRGRLPGLTDGELEQLPVEPEGYQLRQGSTYVNLDDPNLTPFTAMGSERVKQGQAIVPKSATGYVLWNRIVGVTTPEQLDEPPDTPLP